MLHVLSSLRKDFPDFLVNELAYSIQNKCVKRKKEQTEPKAKRPKVDYPYPVPAQASIPANATVPANGDSLLFLLNS